MYILQCHLYLNLSDLGFIRHNLSAVKLEIENQSTGIGVRI